MCTKSSDLHHRRIPVTVIIMIESMRAGIQVVRAVADRRYGPPSRIMITEPQPAPQPATAVSNKSIIADDHGIPVTLMARGIGPIGHERPESLVGPEIRVSQEQPSWRI